MEIQLLQNVTGPYVEFNVAGSEDGCNKDDSSSYYLDNYVCAIFSASFAAANDRFDRHGSTLFSGDALAALRAALGEQRGQLAAIANADMFIATVEAYDGHHFLQMLEHEQRDYQFEWPALFVKLLLVNSGLLALVNKCQAEEQVLWVLGL